MLLLSWPRVQSPLATLFVADELLGTGAAGHDAERREDLSVGGATCEEPRTARLRRACVREPQGWRNEQERQMHEPDRFPSHPAHPSNRVEPESARAEDDEPGAMLGRVPRDGRGRVGSDHGAVAYVDSGPASAAIANLAHLLLGCPNTIGAHGH